MAYFGTTEEVSYNPLNARDIERERHRRALAEWERSQSQMLSPEVRQFVEHGLAPGRGQPVNIKAMTQAENAVRDAEEQALTNPMLNRSPNMVNLFALQQLQQGLYSEPGYGAPKPHVPVQRQASPVAANDAGQLYPTAGNYTNGAFNNFLMSNRIQEPTMQGVMAAQDEAFQRSPEVVKANAKIQAERAKAQAALEKQRRDLEGKKEIQGLRTAGSLDRINLKAKLKTSSDAYKAAEKLSQDTYKEYAQKFRDINNYKNKMTGLGYSPEEIEAHLKENGLGYVAQYKGGPPRMLTASEYVKTPAHQDDLQKLISLAPPESRKGIEQYYKSNGIKAPTESEIIETQVAKEDFSKPGKVETFVKKVKPLADQGIPKFQKIWESFVKHHGNLLEDEMGAPVAEISAMEGPPPQAQGQPMLTPGDPMRAMNIINGLPPGTPRTLGASSAAPQPRAPMVSRGQPAAQRPAPRLTQTAPRPAQPQPQPPYPIPSASAGVPPEGVSYPTAEDALGVLPPPPPGYQYVPMDESLGVTPEYQYPEIENGLGEIAAQLGYRLVPAEYPWRSAKPSSVIWPRMPNAFQMRGR